MSGFLEAGTYRGGVTVAGVAIVAAAYEDRRGLDFQNTSDTDMWLTQTGTVPAVGVGFKIAAGQGFGVATNQAVQVYCAVAGKTFAATEY